MSIEISDFGDFLKVQLFKDDKVCLVTFNKPKRKNSLTLDDYMAIEKFFQFAKNSDDILVVILTGSGDFYSSGNDMSAFMNVSDFDEAKKIMIQAKKLLNKVIDAFITFPKILIVAANGPVIGIACTTMFLSDLIYAVPSTYFWTPFTESGQSPEGCSSVTFPNQLGTFKANEMLLLGKKLSIDEAVQLKLVNSVFSSQELIPKVLEIAKAIGHFPKASVLSTKRLLRPPELIEKLQRTNEYEIELLHQRWNDPEFIPTVMNYMLNKRNSKL